MAAVVRGKDPASARAHVGNGRPLPFVAFGKSFHACAWSGTGTAGGGSPARHLEPQSNGQEDRASIPAKAATAKGRRSCSPVARPAETWEPITDGSPG
jgi:hypothetical protein